jgi:hypothetical protein
VEAFDLAVGLRSVGAGPLGRDAVLGADLEPQARAVARAVVGEDALDPDALLGEPSDGALPPGGRRGRGLVVSTSL